ncbi:MAG: hypothetical protein IT442_15560 [Phycisphaeraceae bacterium]|nr:hypothetical protein [Phycisphaeraceae bacterium]
MTDRTEPSPALDAEQLVELLRRQESLFNHLAELSVQQEALINQDNAADLLSVLGQRQQVIDQLNDLSQQFKPFRSRWDAFRSTLPAATRQTVEAILGRIENMQQAVAKRDEADCQLLRQRQQRISGEFQHMARVSGARMAYRSQTAPPPARLADQRG